MVDTKTIPIAKIHIPEDRLRPVNETSALILAASIKARGLVHPIRVRPTPRLGATPYTLVAGGQRLHAHQLLGMTEIRADVVKIDAEEARRVEVDENLFRDELTALQRAVFVKAFRELWEEEHGKISPKGGRPRNSANFAEFSSESAAGHFFRHALDRIGLSERGIQYAYFIADNLIPALQAKLRGTPAEDNQSRLLALAKLPAGKQKQLIRALEKTGGDIDEALLVIADERPVKPSASQKLLSTLFSTWKKATPEVRRSFVTEQLSENDQRAVYETLKAKFGGSDE